MRLVDLDQDTKPFGNTPDLVVSMPLSKPAESLPKVNVFRPGAARAQIAAQLDPYQCLLRKKVL